MEVDHRVGGVESEVADAQAGQLAASGRGVIHQDHEDLVPLAGGRGHVGLLEQGLEGRLGQRLDDLARGLRGGNGGEFEAERDVRAVEEPGVGEERPQRHEALVAGGGGATAFALQPVKELEDEVPVDPGEVDVGHGQVAGGPQVGDEQVEGLAVGADRVRAAAPLVE